MIRRILAILLIVLGLGTAGAAIASGTIWRPDDQVTATLPDDPEVPLVVIGPGVLDLVDPTVRVTVTGATPETPLVLAMGREADVRAWVADAPHVEVTGLTDWETLAVTDGTTPEPTTEPEDTATGTESPTATESPTEAPTEEPAEEQVVPNPAGSDLWVEEVSGTGELTYDWTAVDGRWATLLATDGTQPAPQVSLTWAREVTTPFVLPGVIVGSVLFLIGLALLTVQLLADREARRARLAAATLETTDTGSVRMVTDEGLSAPLTRRQIREAEAARLAEERRGRRGRKRSDAADGALAEGSTEGTTAEVATAGTSDEEPPTTESTSGQAAGGSLADWVRSGRAGADAAPIETYPSTAPGSGLPSAPEGTGEPDDSPTADGTPAGDDAAAAPVAAAPRKRWWRRTADGPAEEETPVSRRRWRPERWGAPTTGAGAAPEPAPAPAPDAPEPAADEPNPQASGASWRQTWGLGPVDAQATGILPAVPTADGEAEATGLPAEPDLDATGELPRVDRADEPTHDEHEEEDR